jgi:hypothetical protein
LSNDDNIVLYPKPPSSLFNKDSLVLLLTYTTKAKQKNQNKKNFIFKNEKVAFVETFIMHKLLTICTLKAKGKYHHHNKEE